MVVGKVWLPSPSIFAFRSPFGYISPMARWATVTVVEADGCALTTTGSNLYPRSIRFNRERITPNHTRSLSEVPGGNGVRVAVGVGRRALRILRDPEAGPVA